MSALASCSGPEIMYGGDCGKHYRQSRKPVYGKITGCRLNQPLKFPDMTITYVRNVGWEDHRFRDVVHKFEIITEDETLNYIHDPESGGYYVPIATGGKIYTMDLHPEEGCPYQGRRCNFNLVLWDHSIEGARTGLLMEYEDIREWYQRGNTSYFDEAFKYHRGKSVKKDYVKALELYLREYELSGPRSATTARFMALIYKHGGHGVEKNSALAIEWDNKADALQGK